MYNQKRLIQPTFTLLFFLFFLMSCSKHDSLLNRKNERGTQNNIVNPLNPLLQGVYEKYFEKTDNTFSFSVYTSPYTEKNGLNPQVKIEATALNGKIKTVDIDNIKLLPIAKENGNQFSPKEGYNELDKKGKYLCGKLIEFIINRNDDLAIQSLSKKIYVPERILFSLDENYSFAFNSKNKLTENQTIHWNVDPKNINGVVVKITYFDHLGTSSEVEINNYDIVPDNGSLTLSENYFKNIPNNVPVVVTLIRGNIDTLNMGDTVVDIVKIFGYSETTASFFYSKQ